MSRRIERINEILRERISNALQRQVKDPRLSNVIISVTAVEATADLSQAKVYVSILATEEEKEHALDGCRAAAGFIRRLLRPDVTFHRVPDLIFLLDNTIEEADRLSRLIRSVQPDA